MVSQAHAWCTEGIRRALSTCSAKRQAGQIVTTLLRRRKKKDNRRRDSPQPVLSWKCNTPEWLANPVLVVKKNKKWRMCIDYTHLNKACLKDPFTLPRIDQVIDSTAGCDLLSLLDAYSGYYQSPLNPDDQLKTAFITP